MYYDTRDKQGFLTSEHTGLKAARASAVATRAYAHAAWSRSEADAQRLALSDDKTADARSHAKRERYRAAHREAMALRDEVAEFEDEYGVEDSDLDEYGYAA